MPYKTLFVDAKTKPRNEYETAREVKGDQLARDIQAAIAEKEREGYELCQALPVTSSISDNDGNDAYAMSYTSGAVLIFKQKTA